VLRTVGMALVALAACKYPDPGAGDGGMSGDDAVTEDRAYVVAHQSLDGATTKVAVLPTIDIFGEADLSGARTFGANTQVFMAGGKVFIASDRSIKRFIVDGSALTQEIHPIDFVTTDVTRFSGVFAIFDDTHAWYFDREHSEAYALDLEAMTTSGPIFFSSLTESGVRAYPTGAYLANDGIVYMPFFYIDPTNPQFIETEVYVAEFNYEAQSLSTTTAALSLRSAGCARLYPFAKLPDDTMLFLGDPGSLTALRDPAPITCLRRIEPSAPHEIDTGLTIDFDDLTSPLTAATRPAQYSDLVVTWTREDTPITSQAEWDTMTKWSPQVTNLNTLDTEELKNLTELANPIESKGTPGKTFFVDGEARFLVTKPVPGDGTQLYNSSGTLIATFPGTLTWAERAR
jgi:hypothetical protein